MLAARVIPCLLLKDQGLVKTVRFNKPRYIGDPINAVRIFNDKEVDELIFLDITATTENRKPNFQLISDIAGESFMPFSYGGGIRDLGDVEKLFTLGVEKIVLNSVLYSQPDFIRTVSSLYGSQSVIVAMDVKKNLFGQYERYFHGGRKKTRGKIVDLAREAEQLGAGEIFLNSIDRDGTRMGFELDVITKVSHAISIPLVACGGAGCNDDFAAAVRAGASGVAAGSMFVFHGRHNAVLITYPSKEELDSIQL